MTTFATASMNGYTSRCAMAGVASSVRIIPLLDTARLLAVSKLHPLRKKTAL